MNKEKVIFEYCTGCGLCHSVLGIDMKKDERGFYKPELNSKDDINKCYKICPCFDSNKKIASSVWGDFKAIHSGWSSNEDIRHRSSTGGILSSLLIYLLDKKYVDSVIQVGVSKSKPWATEVYFSTTSEEIIEHSGSRYAASSPLMELGQILKSNKKYAFVGRPCDIVALNRYAKVNPSINEIIPYKLSFFCGSMPTEKANLQLVRKLVDNESMCDVLRYRGNGWPGKTVVIDKENNKHEMSYDDAWGKILGRDVLKSCRFCIDGIGEEADIVCGDAWYPNKDMTPDFNEHKGRNVILARNETGVELLNCAAEDGYIVLKNYDLEQLDNIQKSQKERRETLYFRILALKIFHKSSPFYNRERMRNLSINIPFKQGFFVFAGTVKRILLGKI